MEIHRMVPAGLSYKGSMRQNLVKIPLIIEKFGVPDEYYNEVIR